MAAAEESSTALRSPIAVETTAPVALPAPSSTEVEIGGNLARSHDVLASAGWPTTGSVTPPVGANEVLDPPAGPGASAPIVTDVCGSPASPGDPQCDVNAAGTLPVPSGKTVSIVAAPSTIAGSAPMAPPVEAPHSPRPSTAPRVPPGRRRRPRLVNPRLRAARGAYLADAAALGAFLLIATVVYRSLVFTHDIAADPLLMRFTYPYRQFAAEALRDGRLPLWNPYLFTGVPFLAEPRAAALYPPHLALFRLDAPEAVAVSVVAHALIAAAGAYVLARACLRTGALAAFVGGAVFAFGGYMAANTADLTVAEAAAWMPLALVGVWVALRRLALGVALAGVALGAQALAGNPHLSALTLLAAALLLLVHVGLGPIATATSRGAGDRPSRSPTSGDAAADRRAARALAVALAVVLVAAGLSAVQLLPSWELSQRSARPHDQDTPPSVAVTVEEVTRALLPWFGDTSSHARVAYAGFVALGLAVVGLRRGGRAAVWGAAVICAGFLIAFGYGGPLSGEAPGWGAAPRLFARPEGGLALAALGVAVLAALGLDTLDRTSRRTPSPSGWRRHAGRALWCGVALAALAAVVAYGDRLALPSSGVRRAWVGLAVVALDVALVLPALRPRRWVALLVAAGVVVELGIAADGLPFDRTAPAAAFTASSALSWRVEHTGDPPRVARIAGVADDAASEPDLPDDYVAARAGRDRLLPPTGMLDHLATLEGPRTELLPLQDFIAVLASPAGRAHAPRAGDEPATVGALDGGAERALASRLGAGYVLGPAGSNLRVGGVTFEVAAHRSRPADAQLRAQLDAEAQATGVALLVAPDSGWRDGQAVLELTAVEPGGAVHRRTIVAGVDVPLTPIDASPRTVMLGDGTTAAYVDAPLGRAAPYLSVTMRGLLPGAIGAVRALSLVDERDGSSLPLPLEGPLAGIAGTEPPLYRIERSAPRTSLTRQFIVEPDRGRTLAGLADLPEGVTALDRDPGIPPGLDGARTDTARLVRYTPGRVEVLITAEAPALLVLRDTYYPGWQAWVDGEPSPILRADGLFRAVVVPAGSHSVTFEYRPGSLRRGALISGATLLGLGALVLWSLARPQWLSHRRGRRR